MIRGWFVFLLALGLTASPGVADEFRVAVASNFAPTLHRLVQLFEQQTGHKALVSPGSTGKHYAQIVHGAPFDAFFSADSERPTRLEQQDHAIPGTRFTYAIGQLVLWSPDPHLVDSEGEILEQGEFHHLAIANPALAPYGAAARKVLERRALWDKLQPRIVRGENVAQTLHFVITGNAELGFVARCQLKQVDAAASGSTWIVPTSHYPPIEQQAVLLSENEAARAFVTFVRSDAALQLIRDSGYNIP